jgi:hypothetical protein
MNRESRANRAQRRHRLLQDSPELAGDDEEMSLNLSEALAPSRRFERSPRPEKFGLFVGEE